MLETELKYFKEHEKELARKYAGKVIVIMGENVMGEYPNELVAYTLVKPACALGTFLIKRCSRNHQTSNSRLTAD
ncbi:MAG: hypothetical protein WAO19_07590 [Candidatus Kryptoniota bacterium]